MKHGSLFSGIGGFDLAAELAGFENLFYCEWNPFCRKVLKHHFPNSESYEDITKTDFTKWRGKIDVLTGGFPCQPFSVAGSRKGAEDDRYLWPQMLRAIEEIRPTWVIGENVAGILSMVLPGEEIKMGCYTDITGEGHTEIEERQLYVVERICKDFERIRYSVQPIIIPACAVGAPHRRYRVWFVANTNIKRRDDRIDNRRERHLCNNQERNSEENKPEWDERKCRTCSACTTTSNADSKRLPFVCISERNDKKEWENEKICLMQHTSINGLSLPADRWNDFPTQSPVCNRNDGISIGLAGISFSKWRQESIKALGNAIVPQVAYEIFKAIKTIHDEEDNVQ